MEKYIKLMRTVAHFKNLKPADMARIFSSGNLKRYQEDDFIYLEKDPSAGMFVLFSGKVSLCNHSFEGDIQILSVIEPVIMFNELTAIDGGTNPATAIAGQDCLTWNISHESFEKLVKDYPDPVIGLAMMKVLAKRTRKLINRCEDLAFRPVLSRCAKKIFELSEQGTVVIDRTKYPLLELAAWVSATPESVSRSLKCLDQKGIIAAKRSQIEVIDKEELARLAAEG